MEYRITSERVRSYQRSVLIDGILVTVAVDGREGTVTADRELPESIRERLEGFYGIEFVEEGAEPTVDEDTTVDEDATVEEETTEEEVVSEEVVEEDATPEEPTEEVTEEDTTQEEPVVSLEGEDVSDVEETADGELTRSEVEELYGELGSWTAVAEHLGVSDYKLRQMRSDLGL